MEIINVGTPPHLRMCECGHPWSAHLADQVGVEIVEYGCSECDKCTGFREVKALGEVASVADLGKQMSMADLKEMIATQRAKNTGVLLLCLRCSIALWTCRGCGARCCTHRSINQNLGDKTAICERCE